MAGGGICHDVITGYPTTVPKGIPMEKFSLTALARLQLETARRTPNGRGSKTVYGGHEHVLRQTVIAMVAGSEMKEHENPDEATIYVFQGRVNMVAGDVSWNGSPGDLLIVPASRHSLQAIEDSVILMTVAKLP